MVSPRRKRRLERHILQHHRSRRHLWVPIIAVYHAVGFPKISRRHPCYDVARLLALQHSRYIRGSRWCGITIKHNLRRGIFLGVVPVHASTRGGSLCTDRCAPDRIQQLREWLQIAGYPTGDFRRYTAGIGVCAFRFVHK